MYIYQRIRDVREDKDISQNTIAEMLGEHYTTYRRWETGETEIPCHIVIKLAQFYKVSTDYLLGLSNSPKK